jgi:uncharacterized protein
MATKYVLLYESAEDVLAKAPAHFEAHSARGQEFHQRGSLLAYGPFGGPQEQGSMAIFTSREAAEEFVRETRSSSTEWSAVGRSMNGTRPFFHEAAAALQLRVRRLVEFE